MTIVNDITTYSQDRRRLRPLETQGRPDSVLQGVLTPLDAYNPVSDLPKRQPPVSAIYVEWQELDLEP